MKLRAPQLFLPEPPWLLRTAMAAPVLLGSVCDDVRGDLTLLVRWVDGRNMATVERVFAEFGAALEFPDYYGRNSAALEECLTDLSWLPSEGYVIVIRNAESVLTNEPATEMHWLIGLLSGVCEGWGHPVAEGEQWDRPAVPFHVVFQYEPNVSVAVHPLIAALPELSK